MTYRDAFREGSSSLRESVPETASLDASVLLAAAAGVDRAELIAMYPDPVVSGTMAVFRSFLDRRLSGEPVAYITGKKEFYGREFLVDRRVLIPRPETELLAETAVSLAVSSFRETRTAPACHDACTGSGAVAVTLERELSLAMGIQASASASDISPDALDVARANAKSHDSRVSFVASDFLSGVHGAFHVITANPPYVTTAETDRITSRNENEPRIALDGGVDGLDAYRTLIPQAFALLLRGGWFVAEIGSDQADEVLALLSRSGYGETAAKKDLAGLDRLVMGRKPWTD